MVFLPNASKRTSWRRGGTAILLFVLLWAAVAHSPLIAEGSLPNPWETVDYFLSEFLGDSGYWSSWWVSFQRVLYGFLAAQLLGIPLGLLLGLSRRANAFVFPVFELLRPIPPLAWVPLSILFWPTTESSIVFITTVGAFFIIVMNVLYGIHGIPKQYLWQARSLGARRSAIFLRIILPAILPSVIAGMVLGIAVTWNVLIAAEMIASDSGLGRLTWEGYVSATPAVVIIGMASIGLAGVISTALIHVFERAALRWRSE